MWIFVTGDWEFEKTVIDVELDWSMLSPGPEMMGRSWESFDRMEQGWTSAR